MPGGRPSDYTPAIADEICTRLANGESLRAICVVASVVVFVLVAIIDASVRA